MTRITQYINSYRAIRSLKINEEQQSLVDRAKFKFYERKNGIDGYKMTLYKNIKSFRLDLDDIDYHDLYIKVLRRRQEEEKSLIK